MTDQGAATDPVPGLKGVVAADTEIGDVRGTEGFYHYRQYSAVQLARLRSFEDVWFLLFEGRLPDASEAAAFAEEVDALRNLPDSLVELLPSVMRLSEKGEPLEPLRSTLSLLASLEGMRPTLDLDGPSIRADAMRLCATVPTVNAALWRLGQGLAPIAPDPDLGFVANYLWMLHGTVPGERERRAIEQYMVSTIDHGFNASTFTARVVASTGADVGSAIVAAIGALSGPLHGGAPSRALDTLEAIGTPDRAEPWVRSAVERGERIMGFGHAVYRTDDPRSVLLHGLARELGGPLVDLAEQVEEIVVRILGELKPRRDLYTNVELYAGVVMELCGLPRELFTPTFAASRVVGWSAHVREQAPLHKIIRPSSRYVGPPPPQPVPSG